MRTTKPCNTNALMGVVLKVLKFSINLNIYIVIIFVSLYVYIPEYSENLRTP